MCKKKLILKPLYRFSIEFLQKFACAQKVGFPRYPVTYIGNFVNYIEEAYIVSH